MRLNEAMDLIEHNESGYRVHFEVREGSLLRSDYFPETDEDFFKTDEEAWELASRFAKAVDSTVYVNIYVVDQKHQPVQGYNDKKLNRH